MQAKTLDLVAIGEPMIEFNQRGPPLPHWEQVRPLLRGNDT